MQNSPPVRDNIASVIVTLNPDLGFAERLNLIAPQVGYVVVVDNGSESHTREVFHRVTSSKVEIIINSQNVGLASALNQGVRQVAALGFSWVLTLDQDTLVDHDLVDRLREIYDLYSMPDKVGLIACNARSPISGRLYTQYRQGQETFVEVKTPMTSGSLHSVVVYERIGPFRDDFFIEGIDLEYCLRLRKYGYKVLFSCRPLMTHAAGKGEEHRFFQRVVLVPNHPPWRYYYQLRNLLFIVREYFWQEPSWVLMALINLAKTVVRILLYERDRRARFRAILQGIRDGISSTGGRATSRVW